MKRGWAMHLDNDVGLVVGHCVVESKDNVGLLASNLKSGCAMTGR